MECYKIRIDTQSHDLVQKLCTKYAQRYLYSFEKIGTPDQHTHIYMETFHKETAIRAMIRKRFGSGNGVYSMKRVDHEPLEYLAYCVKSGTPYYNMPEDIIQKAKDYDDKVKKEIKQKKESRRTQLEIIREYVGNTKQLFEIAQKVVEYYKEKGTLYRRFYAMSVVETIYLQNNEDAIYQMANDIYSTIRNR